MTGRMVEPSARTALVLDGRAMDDAKAQLFKQLTPAIQVLESMPGTGPVVMYGVIPLQGS